MKHYVEDRKQSSAVARTCKIAGGKNGHWTKTGTCGRQKPRQFL